MKPVFVMWGEEERIVVSSNCVCRLMLGVGRTERGMPVSGVGEGDWRVVIDADGLESTKMSITSIPPRWRCTSVHS